MAKKTVDLIAENGYEGLLAQDGWETTELTVRANHGKATADRIIKALGEAQGQDSEKEMVEVAKETKETKATKKAEPKFKPCGCGCGTMVKSRFAMGHDARLKGALTRVIYWNKATKEHPRKPTDAQVAKAVERMAAEGWAHKVDQKRADQAARVRKGDIAGLKAGESVKASGKSRDSVLKDKNADAPKPKAEPVKAKTFDADDDIETVD